MRSMFRDELYGVPEALRGCWKRNASIVLPRNVPCIGMGSSYAALFAPKYAGVRIFPELASEVCGLPASALSSWWRSGVCVSQSGETPEVIGCTNFLPDGYIAITNHPESSLAKNAKQVVTLEAGQESYSAAKSFLNTLLVLYLGFELLDRAEAAQLILYLEKNLLLWESEAASVSVTIRDFLMRMAPRYSKCHIYILGDGVNFSAALQGALITSETAKAVTAQAETTRHFDHGWDEAAGGCVVLFLEPTHEVSPYGQWRSKIKKDIAAYYGKRTLCVSLEEPELRSDLTPFAFAIELFFLADFLRDHYHEPEGAGIGAKVTK